MNALGRLPWAAAASFFKGLQLGVLVLVLGAALLMCSYVATLGALRLAEACVLRFNPRRRYGRRLFAQAWARAPRFELHTPGFSF